MSLTLCGPAALRYVNNVIWGKLWVTMYLPDPLKTGNRSAMLTVMRLFDGVCTHHRQVSLQRWHSFRWVGKVTLGWLQGEETTGDPPMNFCWMKPSLDWFYRLNFVSPFMCLGVGLCTWMQVLAEARRGQQSPHNWSYRWLLCLSWRLGTEPWFSRRAASGGLYCRTISSILPLHVCSLAVINCTQWLSFQWILQKLWVSC